MEEMINIETSFDTIVQGLNFAQMVGVVIFVKGAELINKSFIAPRKDKNIVYKSINKALNFIGLYMRIKPKQ